MNGHPLPGLACAMISTQQCEEIHKEYQSLQKKQQEVGLLFQQGIASKDLAPARRLKKELQQRIEKLNDLVNPIEKKLRLKEQYDTQVAMLERLHIVEQTFYGTLELETRLEIEGIDGKSYPVPSYEEVLEEVKKNEGILKKKYKQGFTLFLLVPFGMELDFLINTFKEAIRKYKMEGKIQEGVDSTTPLQIGSGGREYYRNVDRKKRILYFPEDLPDVSDAADTAERRKISKGRTKQEILDTCGAWQFAFVEDMRNIPWSASGAKNPPGGRPKLDRRGTAIQEFIKPGCAFPSAKEYLKAFLTKEIYQHETGLTIEDWIMLCLTYIDQKGEILDNQSATYLVGSYFPSPSGEVPDMSWDTEVGWAVLIKGSSNNRDDVAGIRTAVRMNSFVS